jgi:hypothetical protein
LYEAIQFLAGKKIRVIALSCDNCSVNIAAYKLLTGDPQVLKDKVSIEERRSVNLKRPIVLLRCMAHILDLILQ